MRLLIYGSRGWIGTQFTGYLDANNIEYLSGTARVDNTPAMVEEITRLKPTHVLSLIGRTSGVYNGRRINTIDYLEQRGNLQYNVRDNIFAPISLALTCKEHNIHFTYLGTGCIFDYDNEHTVNANGWTEEDLPNFFGSGYSTVKGFTDRLMHQFDNVLNLRIRMPISPENHPRNFITKITEYEKICSIPNSMTVLHTFFPIFIDLMSKNVNGTFNCTNPGVISHNEILTMYREIVDPTFVWQNFDIEEQDKILDSKRSNNYLDTTKLSNMYNVPDIHTAVRQTLVSYSTK